MSKTFRNNLLCAFYLAVIAAALVVEVARWRVATVQAQPATGEKMVDIIDLQSRENAATIITRVMVGDVDVQCGLLVSPTEVQPVAPFRAGSDWLQHMTISLFNRTNKTIVAAHLSLIFPETGRGGPQRAVPLLLGRVPEIDSIDGRTGKAIPQDPAATPLTWAPGQTLSIHVGEYIDRIKEQIEDEMPLAAVSTARIHIGAFFFADGMKWGLAAFHVPDPEHPGKFIQMPEDYFPGDRYLNWPPRNR